jgi:uncharacterized protein
MAKRTRFFQDPSQSFFLFGPRGTGKSTWLKASFPAALYIDLLDPEIFRTYSARPERLKDAVNGQKTGSTIVIDEVQKLPELLDVVHLIMEESPEYRFILTGSSSRKLKQSGVDLLAGRAIVKTLHPFMAMELEDSFSLEESLNTGLVPLVADSSIPMQTLGSYISIYIQEEVKQEGLVRNIGDFNRFLEAISFSHGSALNVSEVGRECQVNRKTVEGYLSILEDLLLSFKIDVFSKRAKRHLVAHPKFYFFDVGVFRALRPMGPIDSPSEVGGGALEGLIAQHLRAWIAYRDENCKLYYWRTKSGTEVDFVLYGENVFDAIEVKNSTRIDAKMLRGLRTFREDYPEARLLFLYRGKERLVIDGILCLPSGEFLEQLSPELASIAFY